MTLPQILRILWARRRIVLGAGGLLLVLALAVSQVIPKTYQAEAEVLIDLRAPDAVSREAAPHAALAALVGTQVDVISSKRVALKVVQTLQLDKQSETIAAWQDDTGGRGDIVDWAADLLLEDLTARADAAGSVIRVGFHSQDPAEASRVANAFVQAYLDTAANLKVDPARENAAFFSARVESARDDLALAKRRLSDYQREHKIIDPSERFDVENERLSALAKQQIELDADVAQALARGERRGNQAALPEVLANPVVQRLRELLAQAESDFRRQAGILGSAHPTYIALQNRVASLRSELQGEIGRQASSTQVAGGVSTRQADEIARALDNQRLKVLALKEHRDNIDLLRNEVQAAQKAYELVAERSALSSLESLSRQTNASLLTPAVVPVKPSSPKVALNTVVGAVLGLLLGAVIALVQEAMRPKVRTVIDLTEQFDLPVLMSLPDSRDKKSATSAVALPRLTHLSLPRLTGSSAGKA